MNILMFGRTGQVATEVLRRAGDHQVEALSRAEADLANPDRCAEIIFATKADIILNAAAWTNVDGAEEAEAEAAVINGAAPGAMATGAAARGIPFLHISTDYVFSGAEGAAWAEGDETQPISAYGWTKLAGEQAVRAAKGPHAILRTAWVFSAHGGNFVKTMLRLGEARDALNVVADQRGGPTPASAIAEALLTMASTFAAGRGRSGTYHFAGGPAVSWAEFAAEIFNAADLTCSVNPITTAEWPTPAQRPANSVLNCDAIHAAFGIAQPDWRTALREVISEIRGPHAT